MTSYEDMLKKGRKDMPDGAGSGERFVVPKAHGRVQGNMTIITNFSAIVDDFRRDAQHFLKYLQRELATPAQIEAKRLILRRKLSPNLINIKIKKYAAEYVLCHTCKKPDTQLIDVEGVLTLKCTACGAKHKVKA